MNGRILLVTLLVLCGGRYAVAQQKLNATNSVSVSNTGIGKFYYAGRNEPARAIEFKPGAISASTFLSNINQYFNIPKEYTFRESESNTDNLGMKHRLMQQYYKGMLIEGMGYRVHEKNGFVSSANGKAVREIKLDLQVRLSEEQAHHLANAHLHAMDTIIGHGRKLIVSKGFTFAPESFSIAFQFDISVSFIEQWRISIDARSGEVINKVSLVNTCEYDSVQPLPYGTGTGKTNYYGNQAIRVEELDYGTRLRGQTAHGGKIGTYDFQNAPVIMLQLLFQYSRAYDVGSSDNIYNSSYQQPAVSAQWAAEQAYEYYFLKHNRNSFDNNGSEIKCYVHVDQKLNNAFWIRNLLAIGDGDNNNPLVELDVIGHELTHGVTQFEAGLQYSNEPGALNESFSDIMGKAIEFDTFGDTATWQIGRRYKAGGIRDMKTPNLQLQPDTYGGDMWHTGYDDNGGVHYNSGVQNFWYYLLCEGGSGVNDLQLSYAVNPIGMDAATKIVYRNLTEYLGNLSDYLDARIGSLLAASDLYGSNSTIYQEVDKAWDAVGVIDEPSITSLSVYDITATTVKIKGSLIPRSNVATYHVEYGPTPALGSSSPESPYSDKLSITLTGLQSQTKYYLKLVATNEHGSSPRSIEFTTLSLAPLAKIKQTVDVTETTATLYGQVNPNSLITSFYFEYGPTPALGQVTPSVALPGATEFQNVSAHITGLQARQNYYYRLKASNSFATATTEAAGFYTAAKPIISSFSPVTATIGTTVTLIGQNFNASPEKNLVNFGSTQGIVLSSSPTEIKVEVPAGASFGAISILDTESGLRGASVREFVPTFTGEFKKGDIRLVVGIDDISIYRTYVEDMDGDRKPDIVADHYRGFSVFQNVSQGGDITSESFIRDTHNLPDLSGIWVADLDGNGLKDIIGRYQDALRIFPNLSVPGYIFFGPPVDLPIGYLDNLVFEDFDLDGHVDIGGTTSYGGTETLTIVRNQNPKGSLSVNNFDLRQAMSLTFNADFVTTNDVNNDGTPDFMIGTYDRHALPILKNDSHPGVFNFEENSIQDPTSGRFVRYLAHDLNNDGKKDVISHSLYLNGNVAIFQNKGTASAITLAEPVVVLSDNTESTVQPADINGDGQVDLMVGTAKRELLFMQNKGTTGNQLSPASFETFAKYGMALVNTGSGTVQASMTINDLNGDGRPEIINAYSYNYGPHDGYNMEIWQNQPANCLDPSLITIAVSNYKATITLPKNTTLEQFEIDYSTNGSDYWQRINTTTIDYIYAGYDYKLRARAKCYLEFTDYYYINFKADCVNANSFSISKVGFDNATLFAYDFGSFEVQYSLSGQGQWKTLPQYTMEITNLLPGTRYDLRFRGRCYKPVDYTYKEFTTLCPKLTSIGITDLAYNRAVVSWASDYAGDAVLEYSDDNATWTVIDKTLTLFPLAPATQYFVRGKLACTDTLSDYSLKQFTTPCPKISTISYDNITPFSARVSWVDESNTGAYTLAYSLTPGGKAITVQTKSTSFNLNDLTPGTQYTVSVTPQCTGIGNATPATFSTVCYAPFNLSASDVAYTTADLSWNDDFGGLPYAIDYSISGSNVWKTTEASLTHVSLTQLRPGTKYEARVHITCPSVTTPYALVYFETDLYEETTFSPNPTDSKITIYPSTNLIGSQFSIYDNVGRVLAHGELLDYTIDLSTFSFGIYTLQIEGEKPMRIVKH